MKSRRRAREAALQALYQCDTLSDWSEEIIDLFMTNFHSSKFREDIDKDAVPDEETREFCLSLIAGTIENLAVIDQHIVGSSKNWSLSRMSRVDRNILRLAVFELCFLPEIPVNVVINEAIELAKSFGCDESPNFINGVIDNIARPIAAKRIAAEPTTKKVA